MRPIHGAIEQAIHIGPLKGLSERIRLTLRDQLAQHFQVAMLREPLSERALKELFQSITGESSDTLKEVLK